MNFNEPIPPYEFTTDYTARYHRAAEVFRALANPDRIRIIELLEGGDISVAALQDQLELPQPTISHHLATLRHAHLVTSRRQKTAILYRLIDKSGLLNIIKTAL